jgi:ABC-type transport system substrate-binding protein
VPRPSPSVDPAGAPEDVRWVLERLLTRGLVDEDANGRIVPMLAESVLVSEDQRVYRFVLRAGLGYPDGARLSSVDIRATLEAGLARRDHAMHRWLLRAVEGVVSIRPGRPLPTLGIETPDSATLILRLARPDRLLLRALALPGVSAPLRAGGETPSWESVRGVGPYAVVEEQPGRLLVLARRESSSLPVIVGPDTLRIRFASGPRTRALMRTGKSDVVWPLPLGDPARGDTLARYRRVSRAADQARPARTLVLVLRADVPPTAGLPARRALAHAMNPEDLKRTLAEDMEPFRAWWPKIRPYAAPSLDLARSTDWMRRGRLGRSFHTTLVFDPDEIHESAARRLQSQWVRADLSVDLRPLRGRRLAAERLEGRAQVLFMISTTPLDDPAADLAILTPLERNAPVGRYRSGWSSPEFRPWIRGEREPSARDLDLAQQSIEDATVVLPLGLLGWSWMERVGGREAPFHPHFGLDFAGARPGHAEAPLNR